MPLLGRQAGRAGQEEKEKEKEETCWLLRAWYAAGLLEVNKREERIVTL
jgi:hypothetical protein